MVKKDALYGAHVSISGGFEQAINRGMELNATAIQIFTKSNRRWYAPPLKEEAVQSFKKSWHKSTVKSIIAHASYLINIASSNHATAQKSLEGLVGELKRCHQLTIPFLVLHPGSRGDAPLEESLIQVASYLDKAIQESEKTTTILIETMAGQGTSIGSTFEQLGTILQHVHHKKHVGICLDTCHIFAAGYSLDSEKEYSRLWQDFDSYIGIDKLHAIHVNDSKNSCGSRVDRHADIGKGKIGLTAFSLLMNDKKLKNIPKVLETPYETLEDYKPNMAVLASLIK